MNKRSKKAIEMVSNIAEWLTDSDDAMRENTESISDVCSEAERRFASVRDYLNGCELPSWYTGHKTMAAQISAGPLHNKLVDALTMASMIEAAEAGCLLIDDGAIREQNNVLLCMVEEIRAIQQKKVLSAATLNTKVTR